MPTKYLVANFFYKLLKLGVFQILILSIFLNLKLSIFLV